MHKDNLSTKSTNRKTMKLTGKPKLLVPITVLNPTGLFFSFQKMTVGKVLLLHFKFLLNILGYSLEKSFYTI